MMVLLRLQDFIRKGFRVTLISPSPYHYYSGMGPGMLSGFYRPQEARFHIRRMVEDRGGVFVAGRVLSIDAPNRLVRLSDNESLSFDVASFNTGSHVPVAWTGASLERLVPVKPVLNLFLARREILDLLKQRSLHLVVVGGGAAGVEVAGNLQGLVRNGRMNAHISLLAGHGLLPDAPSRARRLAHRFLVNRGIDVLEGARLRSIRGREILLSDGSVFECDLAFIAVGVTPSRIFADSGLPTGPRGELFVDTTLRSIAFPYLLGGGDCVAVERMGLAKVGAYAVRQNPILYHNLMAALEGGPMISFSAVGSPMLILNMGDGTGILWKKRFTLAGKMAFRLKHFIDGRFMRKYQVSGELEELEVLPGEAELERDLPP